MKTSCSHPQQQVPTAARSLGAQPRGDLRSTSLTSGVALVVTLIMLSVITFMAVSFLVLSRAEHGSVATETDQTQARLAAETGLQRAIAQALAPMLAQTNEFRYDLGVSTNFSNPFGFAPGVANVTNVNYDYKVGGSTVFSDPERVRNIANLWYDPRPPVFITNRFSSLGGYEFRFFLNLNRNTNLLGPLFDPSGWLAVTNKGQIVGTNWFVGDPQWIGILSSPDRPHAADNRFVSRFAYVLIPAGSTLDLNYIHNQAARPDKTVLDPNGGDFLRNQGVGPWEGNLAAFLCDLNTNIWEPLGPPAASSYYQYDPFYQNTGLATGGAAFADAFSIIRYRYGCSVTDLAINRSRLPSFSDLYPPAVNPNAQAALVSDQIDGYTAGPLMGTTWPILTTGTPPVPLPDPDLSPTPRSVLPWPGANNTNHFFTPQELFNPAETSPAFVGKLLTAGNDTTSSYNEYTFYRMLAQLGTDSAGDGGRINLNYCNVDNQGRVVPNLETNFVPWIPEQFFTNTANALLRAYGYNFTVTNIQVYPTNFYTPNVHRLLQLAANIYDASTNRFGAPNFPTVFRPYFRRNTLTKQVFIVGYHEVLDDFPSKFNTTLGVGTGPVSAVLGFNDDSIIPSISSPLPAAPAVSEPLVVGIPLVIGAKKGFPNFNEFAMQTQATVTRKLHFRHLGSTTTIQETNQMYLLAITNNFGLEAWNSYMSTYPRGLQVRMEGVILAMITNEFGTLLLSNAVPYQPVMAPIAANTWLGSGYPQLNNNQNAFRAVLRTALFLTNSMYSDSQHIFMTPGDFDRGQGFPIPHWYLSLRPMIRFALVDTLANRIIDYVSYDMPQLPADLTPLLTDGGHCGTTYQEDGLPGSMWCTNRDDTSVYTPTYGIRNQIGVSLGNIPATQWALNQQRQHQVDFFRAQFGLGPMFYFNEVNALTNTFDAPYSPTRTISFYTSWQANDPLVHYTIPDMLDSFSVKPAYEMDTTGYSSLSELGGLDIFTSQPVGAQTPLNDHYRPWGGNPKNAGDTAPATNWKLEVKDPLMCRSDNWDFPTNKYPNVGWLGRVHRGTPWQTIYLKSTTNDWTAWTRWTGDLLMVTNNDFNGTKALDALFSLPENDRSLLDLFSAAFNDAAARGRMSVNQQGVAAWSAILSGVVVLTNTSNEQYLKLAAKNPQLAPLYTTMAPLVVQPAGPFDPYTMPTNLWPQVARIVKGINTTRATMFPNQVFHRLGDVLAVPELTVASPFLNQGGSINPLIVGTNHMTYQQSLGLNDAAYERIPQQVLGLLQCDHTPRFVIYAYGQALKPAEHSVITSGPFFQLCTNYQITAEVATRAVVRIDGAPSRPHAVIESFNVLPPD